MKSIHLIEGVWHEAPGAGGGGLRATDAAASCCAAVMAPGDAAVVLGPAAAARRVASLGVPVAGAWSAPLGMHGLWMRPLRTLVSGLGPFDRAVAWTPGALRAASGLGVPVTDESDGASWAQHQPGPALDRAAARRALLEDLSGVGPDSFLIGLLWDPPGTADALTGVYGVGLLERAGLLDARAAVTVVPRGARGVERAERLAAGVGQVTALAGASRPLGRVVAGLDVAVVPPLEASRGLEAYGHLRAARAWWIRRAVAARVPVVAGPADAEEAGVVRMQAWGRAELGRALREVLMKLNVEAGAV